MIEDAIFAIFNGDTRIAAEVEDRIWPLERPQGSKLPAITFQRAGGSRDYDMEGATGLVESRFLFFAWGEKAKSKSGYLVAKQLQRLMVTRLQPAGGFRETIGSTEIQSIFINNEDDTRTDGATGVGVVRLFLDCTIWHKEKGQ